MAARRRALGHRQSRLNEPESQMRATEIPVDVDVLRDEIQKTYTEVSTEQKDFIFPTGRPWAQDLGYPEPELSRVPEATVASFAGVANHFVLGHPEPGDVVLDVGCGTGLCFPLLQERIGPRGTIVAVDASRQMLDLAAARAAAHGWDNVVLIEARVEDADLPPVDHALFCAVHDVLQSAAAVDNALAAVRPGGGVAAGGGKWAPLWALPLNAGVLALHAHYVGDFTGFSRPWALLAERVPDLAVQEVAVGGGYLASGRVPADQA